MKVYHVDADDHAEIDALRQRASCAHLNTWTVSEVDGVAIDPPPPGAEFVTRCIDCGKRLD